MQLIVVALVRYPPPELDVGRVVSWHEAVTEFFLEFAQLLKSYLPNGINVSLACHPVESNTIECSNAIPCYWTWLSFLIQLVFDALSRNPIFASLMFWQRIVLVDEAVAELSLEKSRNC